MSKRFLVIQTAFIGDAILATALLEELHLNFPTAKIDFVVRQGNDSLFEAHPFINKLFVWDKSAFKTIKLLKLARQIKTEKYDRVINLHRFLSSGIISRFAVADTKAGFDKNPMSSSYDIRIKHVIGDGRHELDRNASLIEDICRQPVRKPKLYPQQKHFRKVDSYKGSPYICVAPTSVWFTKQFPPDKWLEMLIQLDKKYTVYLLGSPSDVEACELISAFFRDRKVENLAGKLGLLESAALMKDAVMNYVNDSAPMHLASSMNAPVTAIFCSTIPGFGFGPLSDKSFIVEKKEELYCRPCGIHGRSKCPEGHFRCAKEITIEQLLEPLV